MAVSRPSPMSKGICRRNPAAQADHLSHPVIQERGDAAEAVAG